MEDPIPLAYSSKRIGVITGSEDPRSGTPRRVFERQHPMGAYDIGG